jgi:hypothetical protein
LSRFVDAGAQVAGWIGLGTAVVVVVAFALVLPIQALVFVLALPVGLLIGWYANARADRRRPRWRALANALWAGLLTSLALAVLYVGIRLVFIYADNGYPDFNISAGPDRTASPTTCPTGPPCTYLRYLEAGRGAELEQAGVTDAAAFGSFVLSEQLGGGGLLIGLTMAGALVAGGLGAIRPERLAGYQAGQPESAA